MTELERVLVEAKKTGEIAITFEGVKNEQVKISMEVQGERTGTVWALRVRLGDGTHWSANVPEDDLGHVVNDFYSVFAKMGRERGRA